MALPLANNADGGTNGTTVSTANSGGTSGDAWDAVTIGLNTTATFDSTVTPRAGGLSYKLTEPATLATVYLTWSTALGTLSTGAHIAGRLYLRMSTLPTGSWGVFRILNGSTILCGLRVTTTGTIQMEQSGASVSGTAGNGTMSANTWYRLEFDFTGVGSASGAGTGRLFVGDATAQTGTDATTSAVSFGTLAPNTVRIGMSSAVAGMPASSSFWVDDLQLNASGMPGSAAVADIPDLVMAPMR